MVLSTCVMCGAVCRQGSSALDFTLLSSVDESASVLLHDKNCTMKKGCHSTFANRGECSCVTKEFFFVAFNVKHGVLLIIRAEQCFM